MINVATGFGVFDFFTIRGFDSLSSSLVLVDGAAEPESSFYHLYNVGRVEVLKGPSAVIFGRGSTGGAINQISKSPSLTPGRTLSVTSGYGPTARAAVDVNQPVGDTSAIRLNLLGYCLRPGLGATLDDWRMTQTPE